MTEPRVNNTRRCPRTDYMVWDLEAHKATKLSAHMGNWSVCRLCLFSTTPLCPYNGNVVCMWSGRFRFHCHHASQSIIRVRVMLWLWATQRMMMMMMMYWQNPNGLPGHLPPLPNVRITESDAILSLTQVRWSYVSSIELNCGCFFVYTATIFDVTHIFYSRPR